MNPGLNFDHKVVVFWNSVSFLMTEMTRKIRPSSLSLLYLHISKVMSKTFEFPIDVLKIQFGRFGHNSEGEMQYLKFWHCQNEIIFIKHQLEIFEV